MNYFGKLIGRALMVGVPAALGVAAVQYAGNLKKVPAASEVARQPALTRVITVEPIELVARVGGYGTVTPAHEWRAVARIEGEVTEVSPKLAPGAIVPAGALLFRFDDSELKLSLANVDAQLAASKVKDETVNASLEIANSDLSLAREELKRQEQLNSQGVVTQSAFDASRRQELVARSKVTDLTNQIALNGAEREVLSTQRASLERSLAHAEIRAPFDLRVNSLAADAGQYVSRGQVLLTGEGIDAVDIMAQFPMGRIGPLVRLAGDGTAVTDLKARVLLPGADHPVSWPATVERMGDAIDERTQSAPLVVRVTDPQAQSVAGERPPLRRNMVVEVELSAPKQMALVVPAEAVQNGRAMVVSADGELEMRPVRTGFISGDIAVVTQGLKAGDKLVITDLSVAVPGMAAKPVEDDARKAEIAAEALGQAPPAAKPGGGAGSGAGKSQEANP